MKQGNSIDIFSKEFSFLFQEKDVISLKHCNQNFLGSERDKNEFLFIFLTVTIFHSFFFLEYTANILIMIFNYF